MWHGGLLLLLPVLLMLLLMLLLLLLLLQRLMYLSQVLQHCSPLHPLRCLLMPHRHLCTSVRECSVHTFTVRVADGAHRT